MKNKPAVHNDGPGVQGVGLGRLFHEAEDWERVTWCAVIGPVGVVVVVNSSLHAALLLLLLELKGDWKNQLVRDVHKEGGGGEMACL